MTKVLLTWKPPRGLERIRTCLDGLDVQATHTRAEILHSIGDADVACVGHWDAEIFRAAHQLRWVHAFSAGVNHLLFPEFVASPIPLTSLKGTFDIPAAEYALGVMLAFTRRIEYDVRRRACRTFEESEPTELWARTAGIVGFGSMGAEIAKRCRAFGMKVLALARRPREAPATVEEWFTAERLRDLLARSDFVVVAVPLTEQTRGMIGEAELSVMRPTAYLIDVSGRPAIYDIGALTRALQARRIAGASLQIVPEPDSPLWALENLLISFHRIVSREHFDRAIETFCENLRRYRAGCPLVGLVDKKAGY
ncbi:MAG: D-2-hydroxyacid dehydrogenase [Planctomycetes bacterium]|nr:D-2-hydroxyacid dehydrogenase [Planctomycetota bacterium]